VAVRTGLTVCDKNTAQEYPSVIYLVIFKKICTLGHLISELLLKQLKPA
jgi:hypothetical protein